MTEGVTVHRSSLAAAVDYFIKRAGRLEERAEATAQYPLLHADAVKELDQVKELIIEFAGYLPPGAT